jgi:hypothetical protein
MVIAGLACAAYVAAAGAAFAQGGGGQDRPPPPQTPASPPQTPASPPQTPASPPQTPTPPAGSKALNPDISVNGNFVAAMGKNAVNPLPPLDLTEVEIAFQAAVDPYARADFFAAVGEEGVEIEEGFVTFTTLPARLLLKAGKMRALFGKVNTLHTHAQPAIDRPLILENLLGSDEGLADAGLSLSHLVPNPALFLELTGEVFRANSELFRSDDRSKLAYGARVRAYRDLTEASNLDVGGSFAFGPTDVSDEVPGILEPDPDAPTLEPIVRNRRLLGVDVTFRYRPLQMALYRRLNLRTELVWSRQDLPAGEPASAFGMYALGEYQFARRWFAGARFDRSDRALDPSLTDTAGAVLLTFWPTEFSQVRGQLRRIKYGEGVIANEFLFQLNFSIGAHAAHVF